jgi:hypothetical protein
MVDIHKIAMRVAEEYEDFFDRQEKDSESKNTDCVLSIETGYDSVESILRLFRNIAEHGHGCLFEDSPHESDGKLCDVPESLPASLAKARVSKYCPSTGGGYVDVPLSKTEKMAEKNITRLKSPAKYSTDAIVSISLPLRDAKSAASILHEIGVCGNGGHSFGIDLRNGDKEEHVGGWDGDGSDRIDDEKIKVFCPGGRFQGHDIKLDFNQKGGAK